MNASGLPYPNIYRRPQVVPSGEATYIEKIDARGVSSGLPV